DLGAEALDRLPELRAELIAQELHDRKPSEQIDGDVAFTLGAVDGGYVQIDQDSLELGRIGRAIGGHLLRVRLAKEADAGRDPRIEFLDRKVFHVAVLGDEPGKLEASDFGELGAQEDVVAYVIYSAHQAIERDVGDVGRKRELPGLFGQVGAR